MSSVYPSAPEALAALVGHLATGVELDAYLAEASTDELRAYVRDLTHDMLAASGSRTARRDAYGDTLAGAR